MSSSQHLSRGAGCGEADTTGSSQPRCAARKQLEIRNRKPPAAAATAHGVAKHGTALRETKRHSNGLLLQLFLDQSAPLYTKEDPSLPNQRNSSAEITCSCLSHAVECRFLALNLNTTASDTQQLRLSSINAVSVQFLGGRAPRVLCQAPSSPCRLAEAQALRWKTACVSIPSSRRLAGCRRRRVCGCDCDAFGGAARRSAAQRAARFAIGLRPHERAGLAAQQRQQY